MARDPSSDPTAGPAAVERALLEMPEVELLGLLRGSSNYTFLARLKGGGTPRQPEELLAVYKPAGGESPLWDFPAGTLYRREVASYLLARALGWPRIPPTVVREDAPHGVGALQQFVEADGRHYLSSRAKPASEWLRIALFDVITNNADRKSGHCLFDARGAIWVIDHGLTFHTDLKLRTVIWDFAGQEPPATLRRDLERVSAELESGQLGGRLGELLSPTEVAMLKRRLRAAARPGWRLPEPTSSWSVPWPPV